MGQVEFRGVPNNALGAAMQAQAQAVIATLQLGLASGVLLLYWQGGDTFVSWLLSFQPTHGSSDAPPSPASSMLDLVRAAFETAGIPFTLDK